jgi:lipopolysaccharide/colanic/teichoic acid biosynthesis glycosyltransferase
MIRFFDFLFSLVGLILLLPVLLIICLIIMADSRGGVFYAQSRVGKNGVDFRLLKFRTMATNAEKQGGLTIGARDSRITRAGYFLRKFKLDELPQLINVLKGQMSLVGPRPEIRKYVDCYTPEQRIVLMVKPGITDYASIEYINENELLGRSSNPEKTYIEEVMPAKIMINRRYIDHMNVGEYFTILWKTFCKLLVK